ncbi:MAG: hydrogenase iron-sulfur subunit [Desulfobacter sp.]|nr:MAG: hydrogenase iron-sulfur subunit [Desulfobacter sp.]
MDRPFTWALGKAEGAMGLTFNVGRLAELVGVHRNTITNWIKKGVLPATPAPAKRYTLSKEAFIIFCTRANIPATVMDRVLSDPSMQEGDGTDRSAAEAASGTDVTAPVAENASDSVMVVGGGIAGIQAALDLADTGFDVFLVEKSAGIGGTMARLDKTFPTDDCAPCILLPRLADCVRRPNIRLITLAEVDSVAGRVGDFKIRIKKTPRYIDVDQCMACGLCAQKCPVSVIDDFDQGLGRRKAVYLPYDQSEPRKYAVDPDACLWLTRKKCRVCEAVCPTGAMNFRQAGSVEDLRVGAVVLAPGFSPYDPAGNDFYGYPVTPDLVTSLEFERLLSAGGPTGGVLLRPSDLTAPKRIAWVQCVGSRHINGCNTAYCSNICCMSTVKQGMAVAEQPGGRRTERVVFVEDVRSHGKESEAYFMRAKSGGIRFVRALPSALEPGARSRGVRVEYKDGTGRTRTEAFDMAVLAIGFEAPQGAGRLARQFGIELDGQGFAQTPYFEPVETSRAGVYAAGAFKNPVAIPRAVVQASAAAASVSKALAGRRRTLAGEEDLPRERDISGEAPSIGVFICSCGSNISGVVDVTALGEYAAALSHVDYVENNLFTCAVAVQKNIRDRIREMKLNRIVIAACSPLTHEHMFRSTLREAGLNGYMVEMANIRNLNAWVHRENPRGATRKAMAQVGMAVARVALNTPLARVPIGVVPRALVVGGGVAGMTAALTIADAGIHTLIVEKETRLGGNALNLDTCFNGDPVGPMLADLIRRVEGHPHIRVCMGAVLEDGGGAAGRFTAKIRAGRTLESFSFGAAVMATGGVEARPGEYGFGPQTRPGVMTQMEFDRQVMARREKLDRTSDVVFIQCVGSREDGRIYCSRICCIHSVKAAIALKQHDPGIRVHILYREIRTYGKWETLYTRAKALGVSFVRYTRETKPVVSFGDNQIRVAAAAPRGGTLTINADYLVLASGVTAGDNRSLAEMFRFSVNEDGFFNGAHPKLRPVDLSVAGLFLAGLCNYPKPMDESIEEARAAGLRAVNLLSQNEIKSDAVKAYVTDGCDGCALCVDACPFGAISLVSQGRDKGTDGIGKRGGRAAVDPALCQGCGICAATCGRDGILVRGFTTDQLRAQVLAAQGPSGSGFDPIIVGFLCNWCSYAGADGAGAARLQYPAGFRPIRVMCSGMVRPDLVLDAFNSGADGVIVLGCHPGECHYIEGNTRAAARAGALSFSLDRMGINPERFGLGWISAAQAGAFAREVAAFSQKIKGLGPLARGTKRKGAADEIFF